MRCIQLIGFLSILFIILSTVAYAEGGYELKPYELQSDYPGNDPAISFWQLPDWIKLFYVTAMAVAFAGGLKAVPVVLGKIDDLLKNENRHSILKFINANPGTTIAEVSQAQNLERGTVKYHLYKLESDGKIVFSRMGKFARIFENAQTYSDLEKTVIGHMQNRTAREVLQLILRSPGITNQELAERLAVEKSAVHWHVDKFLRVGLLNYSQDGKFKRYYISDDARVVVQKYAESLPGMPASSAQASSVL